jgi:hypothetical protein
MRRWSQSVDLRYDHGLCAGCRTPPYCGDGNVAAIGAVKSSRSCHSQTSNSYLRFIKARLQSTSGAGQGRSRGFEATTASGTIRDWWIMPRWIAFRGTPMASAKLLVARDWKVCRRSTPLPRTQFLTFCRTACRPRNRSFQKSSTPPIACRGAAGALRKAVIRGYLSIGNAFQLRNARDAFRI